MADEGPRELFLEGLRPLLEGLTGPRYWGGAYPNAPTVIQLWNAEFQVNQFPWIGILEVSGSQTGHPEEDTQERYEDRYRLELHCYVAGDDVEHPRLWAGRLNRDIKLTVRTAIAPDGPLYGLALWVDFGSEEISFNEQHAYLVLPLTAHLAEPLAA
jgi:hypothetical protein